MRRAWLILPLLLRTAAADTTTITATAVGSLAATDNATSAPDNGNAEGDLFMQIRPGGLLGYESPRMIQELAASVELLTFARGTSSSSVGYSGALRSFYLPTPRSDVLTSIDGSNGIINAFTTRAAPEQTGIGLVPSAAIYTNVANANESASYQVQQGFHAYEIGGLHYTKTDDRGTSDPINHQSNATLAEEASLAFGGERAWTSDSLSLEIGASLLHLERSAPSTSPPGSNRLDRQINPRATAIYRHDINAHWSVNLAGGVLIVVPYGVDPFNPTDTSRVAQTFPIINALAAYADDWGRAAITAGRSIAPNQLIAQNTQNDTIQANFTLPIRLPNDYGRAPRLVGASTLGYVRTQLLDPVFGASQGSFDVVKIDAGVAWAATPSTAYGVRLEYIKQIGEMSSDPAVQAFSFSRTTLFFTFALRWPDRAVAAVPLTTQSTRVDRQDLAPAGEVVVPEEPATEDGK